MELDQHDKALSVSLSVCLSLSLSLSLCCNVNIVTSAAGDLSMQNRTGLNPSLTWRIIDNPQIYEF